MVYHNVWLISISCYHICIKNKCSRYFQLSSWHVLSWVLSWFWCTWPLYLIFSKAIIFNFLVLNARDWICFDSVYLNIIQIETRIYFDTNWYTNFVWLNINHNAYMEWKQKGKKIRALFHYDSVFSWVKANAT